MNLWIYLYNTYAHTQILVLHTACTHTHTRVFGHLWSFHLHHPVLHVRASIWRNVSEHNELAGQGAVSPRRRQKQTHISCTRHLNAPERESSRAERGERHGNTRETQDGERSQGVRLGNTLAAYKSLLLGLLALLPWQRGTVRHPGGRDGPKNLQLSLTSGERQIQSVCVWLLYHFTSRLRC